MAEGGESEKKSTEELLSSFHELTELKEFLESQHNEFIVRQALSKHPPAPDSSDDNLHHKIKSMKENIIQKRANVEFRQNVEKMTKFAVEIHKAFYPNSSQPCPEDPQYSMKQRQEIREEMTECHEINDQIRQYNEEKRFLKMKSLELDEEIKEVVECNRNLMERLNKQKQEKVDLLWENSEQKKEIEETLKKIRVVKYVFQCLIAASGVDMYENEEMRALVEELGSAESIFLSTDDSI